MSRYHASFYHFLISLGIFVVLAYFVLFQWFPGFFYTIDGGWEGMRLIILVDLVIGPLLTLIVYKHGKPGLKFDLSIIALIQATCLSGGVYVVYNERPTHFIYYDGYFYSASQGTFAEYGVIPPNPAQFETAPARVFLDLPENPIERADIARVYFESRVPMWTASEYYVKLEGHMDEVLEGGRTIDQIRATDTQNTIDEWLEKNGGSFDDYAFIPIRSRYRSAYLAIERANREIVGLLEVEPPSLPEPPEEAG